MRHDGSVDHADPELPARRLPLAVVEHLLQLPLVERETHVGPAHWTSAASSANQPMIVAKSPR
jgi:hypothetical protein